MVTGIDMGLSTRRSTPVVTTEQVEAGVTNDDDPLSLAAIAGRRYGRRGVLRGAHGGTAMAALARPARLAAQDGLQGPSPRFGFTGIAHGVDATDHVAPGHWAEVLVRSGDPVLPGAPAFNPSCQTVVAQAMQFGYNNDYVGYYGLSGGSDESGHGLPCVNHESTRRAVMFLRAWAENEGRRREVAAIEMAAHGGSILEVARDGAGRWHLLPPDVFNRRITAGGTVIAIAEPAAGHARLRTSADPTGRRVIGTVADCAGGITPWGTWLMAEEHFDNYFTGRLEGGPRARNHARHGIPSDFYHWAEVEPRWNVEVEPHEPNRFGWIVEVDPFDPDSVPVKRTALGRFKHEGAANIVNGNGRLVVYLGDDRRGGFLFRFVSADAVDPESRQANTGPLNRGTLSAARFRDDGRLEWLPLVFGAGRLDPDAGFPGQADVLIEAGRPGPWVRRRSTGRRAWCPTRPRAPSSSASATIANAPRRDAVNNRALNPWGQIVKLAPPGGDHGAPVFRWNMLVECGDPGDPATESRWNPATGPNGWFSTPDNAAVDSFGRLWIATDQGKAWKTLSGSADGLWALETAGEGRETGRMFFRAPEGAEVTGPQFTPDVRTLFLSVQHPGERFYADGAAASFEAPSTRWPDFDPAMPPRPSVVAITRVDGGFIGA
jgi:hypothetical protein